MINMTCPPNTFPYTIMPGDTFYALARRYGTTVGAIISANPFADPLNLQIGSVICIPRQPIYPPCPEGNYYAIRPGDTLYALALRFNISLDDLIEANPAINPYNLQIGQIICIPLATPPVTCPPGYLVHVVAPGDTMYALALRYGITVEDIMMANPGIRPDSLLIGQELCIP